MVDPTRLPMGVTMETLKTFCDLLEMKLVFGWPEASTYSDDFMKSIMSSPPHESYQHLKSPYTPIMQAGATFSVPLHACIFDLVELEQAKEDLDKIHTCFHHEMDFTFFQDLVMSDHALPSHLWHLMVANKDNFIHDPPLHSTNINFEMTTADLVCSHIEQRVTAIMCQAYDLIKCPNFLSYIYVKDDKEKEWCRIKTMAHYDIQVYTPAAVWLAHYYLEKYHVQPLERYYTGIFFTSFHQFVKSRLRPSSSSSSAGESVPSMSDESFFLSIVSCLQTFNFFSGNSLNFLQVMGYNHPASMDKTLRSLTFSFEQLSLVTRALIDCPETFIHEQAKRKIFAMLNLCTIQTCLLPSFFKLNPSTLCSTHGFNLAWVSASPHAATRFVDYNMNLIQSTDKWLIRDRSKQFLLANHVIHNHVFKMYLLRWHILHWERTDEQMKRILKKQEKQRRLQDRIYKEESLEHCLDLSVKIKIDKSLYIISLNEFIAKASYSIFTQYLPPTVKSKSETFTKIKSFLAMTRHYSGSPYLIVDLSNRDFIKRSMITDG